MRVLKLSRESGRRRPNKRPRAVRGQFGASSNRSNFLPHSVKIAGRKNPGWDHTTGAEETHRTLRRPGVPDVRVSIPKPKLSQPSEIANSAAQAECLRDPNQLRRRERYHPGSSLKRVKIGRRSWVKFGSRLTLWTYADHPQTTAIATTGQSTRPSVPTIFN